MIKQVTETKFLCVFIDQHLSWKPHIDFVSKKNSKSVGIIAKARFYLSSQTLMTLYYSLLLYRHECFTGKYTTRKIHKNYIRDPRGLFSIISHVSVIDDVISVTPLYYFIAVFLSI